MSKTPRIRTGNSLRILIKEPESGRMHVGDDPALYFSDRLQDNRNFLAGGDKWTVMGRSGGCIDGYESTEAKMRFKYSFSLSRHRYFRRSEKQRWKQAVMREGIIRNRKLSEPYNG